ncbi:hypothetical protein ScPMuIL_007008 [Solemya velum]
MDLKLVSVVVLLNMAVVFSKPTELESSLAIRSLLLRALDTLVDGGEPSAGGSDTGVPPAKPDSEKTEGKKPSFEDRFNFLFMIHEFLSNFGQVCAQSGRIRSEILPVLEHEEVTKHGSEISVGCRFAERGCRLLHAWELRYEITSRHKEAGIQRSSTNPKLNMDLKLVMVVMLNVAAVFCMPGGFDMRSLLDTKKRESEEALQFRALLNELKALKREDESTVDENASTVIVDDEASTVDDGPLSVDDDDHQSWKNLPLNKS